jgi:hypothetical protein
MVSAAPSKKEAPCWRHACCWRPRNSLQWLAFTSDSDPRKVAGYDDPVRTSSDVRVSRASTRSITKLMSDSNAEAGIALICTCLPAFVAQFNILRDRVGYGSSRGADVRYEASDTHKLSTFKSVHMGTGKAKKHGGLQTWSDEAELVTQVKSSLEREPTQPGGIVRRVEVTHMVTYASDSDDGKK